MEMKRMKWLGYLMVPFLAFAVSCKDDNNDDDLGNNGGTANDGRNEAVMVQITNSNLAEVNFGQLAYTQVTDSLVKDFGQMMSEDYQSAQDDLDSLASKRNIDLPTTLSTQWQTKKDSLAGLTGRAFDTSYIVNQIRMHIQAKNMFKSIADSTDDPGLKAYVNKYLPVIEKHLMKADSIAVLLGIDTTGFGNDTTGVGNDTTGVGIDTTGVGSDTTGVGNDTTGVGTDTSGTGDTSGVARNYSNVVYVRKK
jgi:predicted outer membrane protein